MAAPTPVSASEDALWLSVASPSALGERVSALQDAGRLGPAVAQLPPASWDGVRPAELLKMLRYGCDFAGVHGVRRALAATSTPPREAHAVLRIEGGGGQGPCDDDVMRFASAARDPDEARTVMALLRPFAAPHLVMTMVAHNKYAPFLETAFSGDGGAARESLLVVDARQDDRADGAGLQVRYAIPAETVGLGVVGCVGRMLGHACADGATECVRAIACAPGTRTLLDGCALSGTGWQRRLLWTMFICFSRRRVDVDTVGAAAVLRVADLCVRHELAFVLASVMGMSNVALALAPACSMHSLFERVAGEPLAGIAYWEPRLRAGALRSWRITDEEDPLGVAQRVFRRSAHRRADASVVATLVVRRAVVGGILVPPPSQGTLRATCARALRERFPALYAALKDWIQLHGESSHCALL